MKEKLKIGILSLGCPRNLVDSENILGRLSLKGYSVSLMEQADVALVNTCAFIDESKRESIDAILDLAALKKEGKLKKIIVYGCLAQRYGASLKKQLPEVDAFVGRISLNHELKRFPITPKHFVYLKICEGCINNCSFCVIPKIKGKFTSLEEETILEKVKGFNRDKVPEINIIGQDITGYGLDQSGGFSLVKLLTKITKRIGNVGWLRLLYLNPERVSDDLLKLIRDEAKICKYIDLPIQHINSRILKLMRRGNSKKEITRLIEKIRKVVPGVALRTSIIVGFPSETDTEFKELLSFLRCVKFERLGAFVYSREEGTPANDFPGQVPEKVKLQRFKAVMLAQQEVSRAVNRDYLHKTIEVLIEEKSDGCFLGRSQYDAPEVDGQVFVKSARKLTPGDFLKVKITDTLEYDLVGEPL
ncbi:MAG: MiaB/RimO family radical SAM methylthiotransferase [Candidatus Omnitrophota bacterium]